MELRFPFEIPSQNITDREHWAKRHKRNTRIFARWLLTVPRPREPFYRAHIISVRKRLIRDRANLMGGAKGLVDALVNRGFLADDADNKCVLSYGQRRSDTPETIIRLSSSSCTHD